MKTLFTLLAFFSLVLNSQTLYFSPLSYQRYQGNHMDAPVNLVHDTQGNIYFLDNTDLAKAGVLIALVKCNANGDTLWSRYFNEANTSDEYGTAIAIDHNDNVIVGGNLTVHNSSQQYAFSNFLVKYSPSGVILATDTFANGKTYNQLKSITVDAFDNIFVAAESENSTADKDILIYKLNPSLQRQWVNVYASSVNRDDEPVKIMCNSQNEIYVAARTWASSSNQNILVLKYNNAGSVLGMLNYDYIGLAKSEYLEGAALNDTCIYLSGQYNQTGNNNRNFVLKVSQSLSYTKATQFDAVTYNFFATYNFIAENNTLALSTQYTNDSLAVTVLDTALTIKYNKRFRGNAPTTQLNTRQSCGGLVFNADKKLCVSLILSDTVRIGTTRYPKYYTRIVQVDSLGNITQSKVLNRYNQIRESKVIWFNNKNYILGQGSWNTNNSVDIYLSVLNDTNWNLLNNIIFNCKEKEGSTDITLKQIQLPNGNFVLGNAHSNSYPFTTIDIVSPAGQMQNSVLLRDSLDVLDSLMFLNKDAYNNIYSVVARRYYDSVTTAQYQTTIKIYKHDPNLQLLWTKDIKYKYVNYALPQITLSDSGNVFMSGLFSSSNTNTMLLKINNAGMTQWVYPVNSSTATIMNNKGLVCNKENVVYLYGSYQVPSPAYQNFSILKFSANTGSLMVTSNYIDTLSSNLDVANHALLLDDKLIATGRYGGNGYQFTASIDTSNLDINWIDMKRYSNSSSGGKSLFTYQGDIFVTGYTLGSVLNSVYWMVFSKYDNSGNLQWSKGYKNNNSDWLITDRYACAAANGNTAVFATSEDVSGNDNKNFKILNYDYSSGTLINSVAWTYSGTVTGCGSTTFDDVPLNINKNGSNDYFLTGYVSTLEFYCTNPNQFYDTFYGVLNTSLVTETKEAVVTQNDFKIFPNPGNTELNVQLDNDISECTISIYNVLGDIVFNTTVASNTLKINSAGFANGIYFIKVRTENKELTGKWIKSN